VLGVKRNNFYGYQKYKRNNLIDPDYDDMIKVITNTAKSSAYTYGESRIKKVLNLLGFPVSRYMTAKMMKEAGVWVRSKKKYKVNTDSNHKRPLFDNIPNRQFDIKEANIVYVADITYIWTQWDNAVAESFFGSLKQERVQWKNYQSRHEAQQDILNYITMFYNSCRLHSTLDYMSPNAYESRIDLLKKVS